MTTTPDSVGVITPVLPPCQPPRRLNQSQHDGREAPPSRERVVDPDRAADSAERAQIAVRASRVRPQPPRRARRRSPRAQLAAAPHVTTPAQSEPTRRPRESRRAASESSTLIARRGPRRSCADLVLPGVRYLSPSRRSRPCRTPLHTAPAAVLLLCQPPRRLPRADTATASERRAASTSFCDRAPPTSSCVRRSRRRETRGSRDPAEFRRRHRALRPLCCSASHRAGSLEPTRRRRASAAPRARRCCDRAPPTSSCVRRSRRRKTRGLVTPPNSAGVTAPCGRCAALPATAPALLSRHGDGERAPRREPGVAATERRRPRRACAGLVVGKRGVS